MRRLTPLFVLCVSGALTNHVFALDVMDDMEMADSTGQAGVTLGLNLGSSGAITFNHIVIEDADGIPAPSSNSSAGGLAYITQGAGKGISFQSSSGVLTSPLNIFVDADSNSGSPVMNIGLKFVSNLAKIKLDAFSVGLAKVNTANLSLSANSRRDIVRTGASGIDINLNPSAQLGVNLQLGHQPQAALFKLSGSLQSILTAEPIQILSYSGCSLSAPCISDSSLKFGFELKASATSTNGIGLNNIYGTVNNTGLVIGNTGLLDSFDVKVADITMGQSNSSSTSIFNNLPNSSMGNLGLDTVKVTDLKVTVRGL